MKLFTKNGHDMFDMRSMLQKAIRRGDAVNAGYAANELLGRYRNYLWKTLLTISAEDCYGIITKEIIACKNADEYVNHNCSGYDINTLFIAKAVLLLVKANKNRDNDYFACNLLNSELTMPKEDIEKYLEECESKFSGIPQYTYDCHTKRGRKEGKTVEEMIVTEQESLSPHVEGEYDHADWSRFMEGYRDGFDKEKGFPMPSKSQLRDVENGCIQQDLFSDE